MESTTQVRKCPIGREAEDTRSRLLVVATRHFARRGFHGTGLRAVTRQAQTSLGSVRYHFGDKAGLYRAVVAQSLGFLRPTVAPTAPGQDALRRAFLGLTQAMSANPDSPRLFLRAALDPLELAGDEVSALVTVLADVMEDPVDGSHIVRAPRTLALVCLCTAAVNSLLGANGLRLPSADPKSLAQLPHVSRTAAR